MKLKLNGLWRSIRKALGLISAALAQLEECWEGLPQFARIALLRYAALNFGLPQPASEADFWRWARGQRDEAVRGLLAKAQALLAEAGRYAAVDGEDGS